MKNEKPSPPKEKETSKAIKAKDAKTPQAEKQPPKELEKEIGGYADSGLKEPTRFGDWEVKGRCSDF